VRSSAYFLTAAAIFYVEEVACAPNCGPGPPTQPTGRTFIFDMGHQTEVLSSILAVYATWPRPGQI
jgi:hypothetical protein